MQGYQPEVTMLKFFKVNDIAELDIFFNNMENVSKEEVIEYIKKYSEKENKNDRQRKD